MFCQKCGKQLPDGAKFCTGCGQPVEQSAGGPATEELGQEPVQQPVQGPAGQPGEGGGIPTVGVGATVYQDGTAPGASILSGKKHRGKAAIGMVAGAAVVVVLLIVGAVSLFSSMGKGSGTYLYVTEDYELMYLAGLKEDSESSELTDEFSGSVYFSSDGKYIYFFEQDPDKYESYADLCYMETSKAGKDGERPERISSKVYRYQLTVLDKGGVLFLKESGGDHDLYYFDGESDTKLADNIYSFKADEKEQYVYYTEQDESDGTQTLYRVALKDGAEEELLDGADLFFNGLTSEILLYGEAQNSTGEYGATLYDVYSVKPGERAEKVAEDVWDVSSVSVENGKLSFTYLTQETEKHTLYDFVTDSTAASDANVQQPNYEDFVSGYSEWGWAEYDWDAYYAAQDAWYAVRDRVSIRESLKQSEYNLTTLTIHSYADGTDTVVAEGLKNYPAMNQDAGIYIYSKADQEVTAVVDLSELSYYSQIYDYIETAEATTYQNVNGVESEADLDDWTAVSSIYSLDGSLVLLLSDGEESALVACKVENNALVLGDVLEDEDFSVYYSMDDSLYYFADISSDGASGNLVRYKGGEATVLAKDASRVLVLEDGTVFKMEDMENGAGSLYVVKDGKDVRIDDEISDAVILSADRMLYVSDGDLYLWEKEESTRLARDVVSVWASNEADYDSFIL